MQRGLVISIEVKADDHQTEKFKKKALDTRFLSENAIDLKTLTQSTTTHSDILERLKTITKRGGGYLENYDYMLFLTEKTYMTAEDIKKLFAYCRLFEFDACFPATKSEYIKVAHIQRKHPSFLHRWVNFYTGTAPLIKTKLVQSLARLILPELELEHGCIQKEDQPEAYSNIAIIDGIEAEIRDLNQKFNTKLGNRYARDQGAQPSPDSSEPGRMANIAGLTREGTFMHYQELDFLVTLSNDAINSNFLRRNPGHQLRDRGADEREYLKYIREGCISSDELTKLEEADTLNNLATLAIQSGLAFETALEVINQESR